MYQYLCIICISCYGYANNTYNFRPAQASCHCRAAGGAAARAARFRRAAIWVYTNPQKGVGGRNHWAVPRSKPRRSGRDPGAMHPPSLRCDACVLACTMAPGKSLAQCKPRQLITASKLPAAQGIQPEVSFHSPKGPPARRPRHAAGRPPLRRRRRPVGARCSHGRPAGGLPQQHQHILYHC